MASLVQSTVDELLDILELFHASRVLHAPVSVSMQV